MNFFAPLIRSSFYLSSEPLTPPFDVIFWAITFVFMIVASYSLYQEFKTKRRFWENISVAATSFFVAGLLLNFFTMKAATFFGWRLWIMLWLLSIVVWFGYQLHYWLIARPRSKKRVAELLGEKKYLA